MKVTALSYQQPWAELILRGEKTMDLRTWMVHHIGALAIHASQTIDENACIQLGFEKEELLTGSVLGLVDVGKILQLTPKLYKKFTKDHLKQLPFDEPLYGWILQNPRRIVEPFPAKGQQKFFELELPDRLFESELEKMVETAGQREDAPFELFIQPERSGSRVDEFGLMLFQRQVEEPQQLRLQFAGSPGKGMSQVATLSAERMRLVVDDILRALREAGYKPSDLAGSRKDAFLMPEEAGVRLGLLFLAIGPVSKVSRVESIARGIDAMPAEEAYYWYSKSAHGSGAHRAQRALRILLAGDA